MLQSVLIHTTCLTTHSKDETPAQLAYYESLGIVRRLSLRDVTVGDMMHQTRNAAVAHSKGQGRVEEVQVSHNAQHHLYRLAPT